MSRKTFPKFGFKCGYIPRCEADLLALFSPIEKTGIQKKTV